MGWLNTSLTLLASAIPALPQRAPTWVLLGPCAAAGAVMVVVGGFHTPLHALVLFAVGASAVLVARHPAWAVVPLLIVDLTLSNERAAALGTSLRLLVTLIAVACAMSLLAHGSSLSLSNAPARVVAIPALIFVAVSTVVNLLFSEFGFVISYLRYQVVIVLTLGLAIMLVRDRRALTIVASASFVVALVSSVVAIGQRMGGPFALYATTSLETITTFGSRVFGLSATPVALANSLVVVAVPALGFLTVAWSDRPRARLPLLLATLVILVGTYLTTTRSAIIAVAAGVLVILAAVNPRQRMAVFGIVLFTMALGGGALALGFADQRLLEGTEDDKSAAAHSAIGQVALAVALDNALLGIGRQNFERVSRAYESEVSLGGQAQQSGQGAVGTIRPHNDFLEVWSSWGIFGLLAYVAVILGALRNFAVARRADDAFVRGLAIGGMAGLVAYATNSFFHNYLDSSVILWCYAGLSASLAAIPESRTVRLAALRRRPIRWSNERLAAAFRATA